MSPQGSVLGPHAPYLRAQSSAPLFQELGGSERLGPEQRLGATSPRPTRSLPQSLGPHAPFLGPHTFRPSPYLRVQSSGLEGSERLGPEQCLGATSP